MYVCLILKLSRTLGDETHYVLPHKKVSIRVCVEEALLYEQVRLKN